MKLAERYDIDDPDSLELRGSSRALDRQTDERVVVKELTLGRLTDWKDLELFEREARALRQLEHPGIPQFVDSFDDVDAEEPRFYLVQSWIEGEPLADLLAAGQLRDEESLSALAQATLEILIYLQSFSPPVVHRDLNPENLIRTGDGDYALVDFGSVAVQLEGTTGGSTVVGTSGYMAPEQLLGRAVPASDLYGLGAALVHALTDTHPADLPIERMKLKWQEKARFGSARFHQWVDRLVEPLPASRPPDAKEALRILRGGSITSLERTGTQLMAARPPDTRVQLQRTGNRLRVTFPKQKFGTSSAKIAVLLAALAAPLLFGIFAIITKSVVSAFTFVAALVLIGGVSATTVYTLRRSPRPVLELDVDRGFRLRCRDTEFQFTSGSLDRVVGPDIGYGARSNCFFLATRGQTYELSNACSPEEQKWLADEIAQFLNSKR